MTALTVAQAIAKLSTMPPEAFLLFQVEGASWAKISDLRLEIPEPQELTGCPDCDETEYLNPDLFKPRVIFSASAEEEVNKLAGAVRALVDAAPNRVEAIIIKGRAGLYDSPQDLDDLSNWP